MTVMILKLLQLFATFFKIGLFTFGGGYAMLPLIREETLAYSWATESEIINFIAVSESTPGPFAINMATYVGSQVGGAWGFLGSFFGSFFATLGVVLPSFIDSLVNVLVTFVQSTVSPPISIVNWSALVNVLASKYLSIMSNTIVNVFVP